MELINKTRSGMISYCDHCKVYHLEFGNLFFRFTEDGFLHFRNYVVGINGTEAARMLQDFGLTFLQDLSLN